MKVHILAFLFSTFCISSLAAADKSDENNDDDDITTLTFLVQYEPEDDNDLIQIGLTVEAKDRSLKEAINKARKVVEDIKNIANQFCTDNPEEEIDCDETVDVSDFEINAEYVKRRKDLVFEEFVVSHEVEISVHDTEKIGELADKLLKTEVTKIDSFNWASNQESDAEEEAIEAGREKSEEMCFHLGMKLHRIVSIEDVEEDEEEDGDEEEEDEEEEEEEPLVYRFNVECIRDSETEARKNQEEQEEDKQEVIENQKKQRRNQDDQEAEEEKKPKQKKEKSSDEKKKAKK